MNKRQKKLPSPNAGDALHSAVKASLSLIPVLGGSAAELFTKIIVPPLSKRRDKWLESLSDGLTKLEKNIDNFSVQSLVNDETFITMLMQASQIAIRNHEKEKLDALRNAVLNVAQKPPDEHFQLILMNFLEVTSYWHIRILSFYQNPEIYFTKAGLKLETGDYLSHNVTEVFKELENKDAFRLQIERDLLHYGLIYSEGEWYSKRTTDTGDKLLEYISSKNNIKA